jgi:hypothetical protein
MDQHLSGNPLERPICGTVPEVEVTYEQGPASMPIHNRAADDAGILSGRVFTRSV